ncbi:hypothetical protein BH09ACT11_BH09ACT11_22780 [soil metagenome]
MNRVRLIPRPVIARPLVAAVAACVVALAGCSSDSGSGGSSGSDAEPGFVDAPAGEIVDAAVAAMQDLDYARLSGSLFSSGQTFTLDMSVAADGSCQGSLGVGDGTMELRSNPDGIWFKGDGPLWGAMAGADAPAAMAAAGDDWVIMPAASGSLAGLCDLSEFTAGLGGSQDSAYSVGQTSIVGGHEVIAVSNDDQGSTAYLRTSAPHYMARIVRSGKDDGGTISFSDLDVAFTVQTPTDTFDLEAFTG